MADLIPIRGIRYGPPAGDLGTLVAPPYDVVSSEDLDAWLARNPFNSLRLERPVNAAGGYEAAAATLAAWLDDGVLLRDAQPMFYIYEQTFRDRGRDLSRRCLLAGVEAQPWESGAVKPHEYTMSGPKEDRLHLLEACGAQFSPLLMVARDRSGGMREFIARSTMRTPDQEGTQGEETHRLWAIPADSANRRLLAPLATESFYIADGHHRYETGVHFKDRKLETNPDLDPLDPARFVLAGLVALDDPGLLIRPTHRVVPRKPPDGWREVVGRVFDVEESRGDGDEGTVAQRLLDEHPKGIVAAGLESGLFHVLTVRDPEAVAAIAPGGHSTLWANLQPNVISYALLKPLWGIDDDALRAGAVEYTHDEGYSVSRLREGPGAVAFLNHAVAMDEVITLADRGERLPQKSTFFHPKLGTGLVFYSLRD